MAATTHRYGHSCRTGLVRNLLFLSHAISPELLQFFPAVNWFFFKADKKAKQSEEKNLKSSCRWTFFALMKKSRKSENHGRKLRKEKKITSLEIMVGFLLTLLLSCLWDVALVWSPVFFNMWCSLSQASQVACSYCSLPSIRACQFAIMPALGLQGSGCETRHREPKELTH